MALIDHLEPGMIVFCKRHGCDIQISKIEPFDPSKHDNHGIPYTHYVLTSHGWYTDKGEYGGDVGVCSLVLKGVPYFKPLVRAESELHELSNLFKTEAEAEAVVKSMGFEYVGKGSVVEIPYKT